MDFAEKLIKFGVVAAVAAGFAVIIAKDGTQLGSFLSNVSGTVVSFGKGIGSIAS